MSDQIVQVFPDSTGKKIDTTELTVGSNTVQRQRIQIAGNNSNDLVSVSSANGLEVDVTRIQGAVAVTQSGVWSVTIQEPLTVDANNLDIRDLSHTTDSIEVRQATHDFLNLNANLQVGEIDVGSGNPIPVSDNGSSLTVDGTVSVNNVVQIEGELTEGSTYTGTETNPILIGAQNDSSNQITALHTDSNNHLKTVLHTINDHAPWATTPSTDSLTSFVDSLHVLSHLYGYNGSTWDRLRSSISNGLEVDVTRIQNSVTVTQPISVDDNGGSLTVDAVNLDIRNLTNTADSVEVLQATHDNLNLNANLQIGNADVTNGNPVPISDAGGSLTVSGTVDIGNTPTVDTELPSATALADTTSNPTAPAVGSHTMLFNGTTWDRMRGDITNGLDVDVTRVQGTVDVSSTDLDIRDLTSTSDSVEVLQATHDNLNLNANLQVANTDVANGNPVPISDAGGSLTVDAVDLDIRDLTSVSDSVQVLQSTHDNLNLNANLQIGDADVSNTNYLPSHLVGTAGNSVTVNQSNSDARSANSRGIRTHAFGHFFNGTTWDRFRGSISNGLEVDVTQVQGTVTVSSTDLDIRNLTSVSDSVEVLQSTHDNLNLNANVQVGNTDASSSNRLPVEIFDASGDPVADDPNNALRVHMVANSSTGGGTAFVDDATFTIGSTHIVPVGGLFDDVSPDSVDEGDAGIIRMSGNRNLYTNIRDGEGNERAAAVNTHNELEVKEANSSTATTSGISATASGVQLLAANSDRIGATIFNHIDICDCELAILLGTGITEDLFTVKLDPGDYYEVPFNYTGAIEGIWTTTVSGVALVTELTR